MRHSKERAERIASAAARRRPFLISVFGRTTASDFMTIGTVLRSPLVHFFAFGALMFVAFSALDERPATPPPDAITMTPREAARLVERFTATWNRAPTEQEMEGLIRDWALEEAYVREAIMLGLDQDDTVIRQRLSLKMHFLAESGAGSLAVDDATLQAYLDANPDRFRRPAQLAFDQVLLPPGAYQSAVEEILAELEGGADPGSVGETTLLPGSVPMTPAPAIGRTFGEDFRVALAELPLGTWQGPVRSGYGAHLVRVTDREEPILPPLSQIRDRVENAWRAARAQEMRDAFGRALLDRYTVSLPSAAEVLRK